jgi:hypothetical protein
MDRTVIDYDLLFIHLVRNITFRSYDLFGGC